MPRRHVDQQVADLAGGDRLEVLTNGFDVEAVNERRLLYDRPALTDKVDQVALGFLSPYLLQAG